MSPLKRARLVACLTTGIVGMTLLSGCASTADTAGATSQPSASASMATPSSPAPASPSPASTESKVPVSEVRGYTIGNPEAPHTLTIWEDLNCPHCKDLHNDINNDLLVAAQKGNVKIEFLIAGFLKESSLPAAAALACAADQDAFLAAHDHAYATQDDDGYSTAELLAWADELNMADPEAYKQCVKSDQYMPYAIAVTNHMRDEGLDSTPTVLYDGEEIDFSQTDYFGFLSAIGLGESATESSAP